MKKWTQSNLKGDPVIWLITFILAMLSILVVYSATSSLAYRHMQGNTEHYLIKHTLLMCISLIAMWIAHKIDYRYYPGIAKMALWISIPMLLITWKYGLKINEASRWLTIPLLGKAFQPSDLAQLALIVSIANMLAKRQKNIASSKSSLLPMLFWCVLICGCIALTNLSCAMLLFIVCILLMYFGRVPIKYLWILITFGMLIGTISFYAGQRGSTALSRIKHFVYDDTIFQTEQSYIAMATGGIYGKGVGKSIQKNFLPHPYSDFIYAIIVEEYGFIGGLIIIILYITLLYRCLETITKSNHAFGGLLAAGLCFSLILQAMINIGVTVGLGPVTGIPLPLISMGGNSLLFSGITLGIILSVSRGSIDDSIDMLKIKKYI